MTSFHKLFYFFIGLSVITIISCCGGARHVSADKTDGRVVEIRNGTKLKEVAALGQQGNLYQICSTIDLNGQTVALPKDCTLQFKKGQIKNGKIVFQNTRLEGKVKIRCDVSGTLSNETVYVRWFADIVKRRSKVQDISPTIQAVFNVSKGTVVFDKGYYHFQHIDIGRVREIVGEEAIILPIQLMQDKYDFHFLKNVFYATNIDSLTLRGFRFEGEKSQTILPGFKSTEIFGEPLIWIDKGNQVKIERCVFKDIENCTYCNKAYTYYGKKQGSCVCLWDVSDAYYIDCEQEGNRHDEQVWIIAVDKPIMDTKVTFTGNYIHDMKPGPNSSAFTCVSGTCYLENNRVEKYEYPGSMFNIFAKKAIIKNNVITDSYCSSVFDVCEYSYFHNDEVLVEGNHVDVVNSVLVLGQSAKTTIKNNVFRGLGLYYSANNRKTQKGTGGYKYWYSDVEDALPTDENTVIEGNSCDFTAYDGNRSIAGATVNYGTGEIIATQSYNNVGVSYGCGILIHPNDAKAGSITISNNTFTSIESLEGVTDGNNLVNLYPYTIKLVNTQNVTIKGNTFNGAYPLYGSPDECTCIGVYNYPDVMEKMARSTAISRKPSEYGTYIIEKNVFNVNAGKTFYPVCVYARVNSSRDRKSTRLNSSH